MSENEKKDEKTIDELEKRIFDYLKENGLNFKDELETYTSEIKQYFQENSIEKPLSDSSISFCYYSGIDKETIYRIYTEKRFPLNRNYPKHIREELKNILAYDPGILDLKNYRLSLGYTQKMMASVLGEPETSYLNWERKKSTPRFQQLETMQVVLNIKDSDMWTFIKSFKEDTGNER